MEIKHNLTQGENASIKRRQIYKYSLGYRFKCTKCNHVSKIFLKKWGCTLSMQHHIKTFHKNLSKKDMLLQYAYGELNNTKTVVFMDSKEFLLFRTDPKERKKVDDTISLICLTS